MGKIISNGIEYSGLMNVEGAFIDTNNVIQAFTQYTPSNSWSYTATQDCVVYIELFNNEGYAITLKLNGKEVVSHYDNTEKIRIAHTIFVKKGQVLTTESSSYPSGVNTRFAVYGIQSGSNVIKAENNYSTDEQVIGKWIDGSDIYQKTYDVTTPLTNNANNKIDANFDSSLYYPISVEATCVLSDGVNVLNAPYVNLNANPTQFVSVFVADGLYVGVKGLSINSASVTIKYIKLSS